MRISTLTIAGFTKESGHLPKLGDWLQEQEQQPDIVALQKIGRESRFRSDVRRSLDTIGYHCTHLPWRSRTDPGVAILSRKERGEPRCLPELPGSEGTESRFLAVEVNDLVVASVYAPYGNPGRWEKELGGRRLGCEKAIDERVIWLQRLREHLREAGYARRDTLLCGDFNVKPKSDGPPKGDAYSEREQCELEKLLDLGFSDLDDKYRRDHPNVPVGFTFDFSEEKPTGGSRLHLAIASEGLAERLICASVDIEADIRKKARPLVVEFSNPGQ